MVRGQSWLGPVYCSAGVWPRATQLENCKWIVIISFNCPSCVEREERGERREERGERRGDSPL